METAQAYKMETSHGEVIPLFGVHVDAVIKDTAIEATIMQRYRNCEDEAIEAVYTFPLPTGAQLLSLAITLNDERNLGKVVEAKVAEEHYEEAITDGDSAMRLQQIDDSLYTLNLGNLQAGDTASIEIHYAQLLDWQQKQLRVLIPTTLGQRYGDASVMGMAPHQTPHTDPSVELRMGFNIRVIGQLGKSVITSPSHSVSTERDEEALLIKPAAGEVPMDRDLVLLLQRPEMAASSGYYDQDLDGQWVAWLSLNPQVEAIHKPQTLKIVVDCSGSMNGVSMQQARVALREIVEQLHPKNHFTIVNFGSSHRSLYSEPQMATELNKEKAYQWISKTEADLGGTEIAEGLAAAYRCARPNEIDQQADILLITDGQTYDIAEVLTQATKSHHRHFTVGVGSAVAEDLVRGLAIQTGGACELVSPNENMAAAIVRHYKRRVLSPVTASSIQWPTIAIDQSPEAINYAFSGDTLHVFARFASRPESDVGVTIEFGEQSWQQRVSLQAFTHPEKEKSLTEMTLARICAARRMASTEDKQGKIDIGLKYQLQSMVTNYLVVAEREHKEESNIGPVLRAVPQMLKANAMQWIDAGPELDAMHSEKFHMQFSKGIYGAGSDMQTSASKSRARGMKLSPGFLSRSEDSSTHDNTDSLVRKLNEHFTRLHRNTWPEFPCNLQVLAELVSEQGLIDQLEGLVQEGYEETSLIAAWFYSFMQGGESGESLSRDTCRAISKAYKKYCKGNPLEEKLVEVVGGLEIGPF